MVDPTITRTCPCGTKVDINQLGQHHHTDCEYDPLHPNCCSDPSIQRLWYFQPDAGTRCENCGKTWGTKLDEKVTAMASHLVDDWNIERKARALIFHQNRRLIEHELEALA